jgi:hypothetical protein
MMAESITFWMIVAEAVRTANIPARNGGASDTDNQEHFQFLFGIVKAS